MNLITVLGVIQFISGNFVLYTYMLILYAFLIPFVALSKIAKMIVSGEIDREYKVFVS